MCDLNIISDIVIPISTFLGGAVLSHFATAKQYKKKIVITIVPDENAFKIYNTGNAGLVIKEIGIGQKKLVWFAKSIDKTLTVDADPMKAEYDENEFWLKVESSIGGKKARDRFCCYVLSASNKKYKTTSKLKFYDLWKYHEYYWGRNSDASENSQIPF